MQLIITAKRADDPDNIQTFSAADWSVIYATDPKAWVFISQSWVASGTQTDPAPTAQRSTASAAPKKSGCLPCSRKRNK